MQSKLSLLIGLLVVVAAGPGCSDKSSSTRTPEATNPTNPTPTDPTPGPDSPPELSINLSLTVPSDARLASKFCPAEQPPLPEDPTPDWRFEYDLLDSKLGGDGLVGWMHGAVHSHQQYVFTYRKEGGDFMDFFRAEQMSLVPANDEIARSFATLNRHDKIKLRGSVMRNGSPLTHILVTSLEMLRAYPHATTNPYSFDPNIFAGGTAYEVFGQVHALAHTPELGWAMILEHKDYMFPVQIAARHSEVSAKLVKGDIVNVSILYIKRERGPGHFITNPDVEIGIDVIDPLVNCHNQERTLEGWLVKFKQSPVISTDVYAVRVVDANGIGRNFTFFPGVSMEDPAFVDIFMEVSAKAKDIWDNTPVEAEVVRNYLGKKAIKVKAKGRINVVSAEQANAQIYILSADDVTFSVETVAD